MAAPVSFIHSAITFCHEAWSRCPWSTVWRNVTAQPLTNAARAGEIAVAYELLYELRDDRAREPVPAVLTCVDLG
jgi:hypothetical protein